MALLCRYSDLVSYMRYNMQTTHIILVAILPRAGWTLADKWAYPNRFTTPISLVNDYIQVCPLDRSPVHHDKETHGALSRKWQSWSAQAAFLGSLVPHSLTSTCWQRKISQVGRTMLAQLAS